MSTASRREDSEAHARRSEERLARLIEALGAGTWELELATQQVWADRPLLELFGLEASWTSCACWR